MLAWSFDDSYLASRNGNNNIIIKYIFEDNMPNILWIWETKSLELKYVLIQLGAIK